MWRRKRGRREINTNWSIERPPDCTDLIDDGIGNQLIRNNISYSIAHTRYQIHTKLFWTTAKLYVSIGMHTSAIWNILPAFSSSLQKWVLFWRDQAENEESLETLRLVRDGYHRAFDDCFHHLQYIFNRSFSYNVDADKNSANLAKYLRAAMSLKLSDILDLNYIRTFLFPVKVAHDMDKSHKLVVM